MNRRSSTGPRYELELDIQRLERRELLAGSVQGVVRGAALYLTGDDLDNSISVSTVAGQIDVTGDGTAVESAAHSLQNGS